MDETTEDANDVRHLSSEDVSALLAEVARLRTERDTLAAELAGVVDTVMAEHGPYIEERGELCTTDLLPWPCPTVEALTSARVVLAEHAEGQ